MSSSTAAPNPSAAATTDDPKSASAANSGKGDASSASAGGVYRDDSGTASVDHSPSLSSSDSEGEEGAQQQEHLVQEVRDLEEQEVYQRFVRGIDKEDMTARVSSSSGIFLDLLLRPSKSMVDPVHQSPPSLNSALQSLSVKIFVQTSPSCFLVVCFTSNIVV